MTNAQPRECPVCPEELDQTTLVEPEIDGDIVYWECPECDYTWGWTKVEQQSADACALGISPVLRQVAVSQGSTVDLGVSIGLRPGL